MDGRLLLVLGLATSTLACSESGTVVAAEDAGSDVGIEAAMPPVAVGGPHLSALDVSSRDPDASVWIGLTPAFSPYVFDYYVRCAPGKNPVTVSMTAGPGASSALLLPTTSPSSVQQTRSLTVEENQAIVVAATAGPSTTEYWVRCLPNDFPQLYMDPHPEVGTPLPGYYLLGNSGSTPGYAMLLDGNGVPVWYVESAMSGVEDVDDVVDGAVSFFETWSSAPLSVRHLNPLMTTSSVPTGVELDTHELRVLPNGHYLVLSDPLVTGVDLGAIVAFAPPVGRSVGPGGSAFSQMFDCQLVEFDPKTGAVAWTWVASAHFDPLQDSSVAGLANVLGVVAVDAFHCNSIDVDPENGNLLVSSRTMNSIFYIDRSTGAVVWKMGGDPFSKDNATYVPVDDAFFQQHDARLRPGWSAATGTGQISVFDDRSDTESPARGMVLDVTTGVGGTTPKATVVWQYKAHGNSSNRGSFRISADGSRVIGWGSNADHHLAFTEVDEEGRALLDFYFADGNCSYRALKAPLSAFDLGVLRRTAGLP